MYTCTCMRIQSAGYYDWVIWAYTINTYIPPYYSGAVGATFSAGTCTSASIRDKDDYVNAAIGGMMAGSIFGFKRKCS